MPILFCLVQGFVYQKGKVTHLPVIVIDKDQTPASMRFRQMLEDHPTLKIIDTRYENLSLQALLLQEHAVAIVVIPDHFEADLLRQKRPEIMCYMNMANTLTANAAGGAVSLCAGIMNAGITKMGDAFKTNTFFLYNRSANYLYFLWPALIFSTLQQLLLLAMAVSFNREFEEGTFNSNGLLGYTRSPLVLLFVKWFPYVVMSLWTIGFYFLLSIYFRIPFPVHPLLLLVSQVLFVTGVCLLGMTYSIIYPVQLKSSQLLMSIASPAFTLSGFTWPSEQAPAVLVALGKIVPLTPYLKILRMTLLQKAGLVDVLPQLGHLLLLIVIYFALASSLLKTRIKKAL